jgi:hypothetical protein
MTISALAHAPATAATGGTTRPSADSAVPQLTARYKPDGPAWPAATLLGAGAVGLVGAFLVNGHVPARIGVTIAALAAAATGAHMLHQRGTTEYVVTLATAPDYTEAKAMPQGPERQQKTFDIAIEHFAAEGGSIQQRLDQLKASGAITGYSGHPFANDFTVQVRKRATDDFRTELAADPHVGSVEAASLGG